MMEYQVLLSLCGKPDVPLPARQTMIEALRRLEPLMDEKSWREFQLIKATVRKQLYAYCSPEFRPRDA